MENYGSLISLVESDIHDGPRLVRIRYQGSILPLSIQQIDPYVEVDVDSNHLIPCGYESVSYYDDEEDGDEEEHGEEEESSVGDIWNELG